MDAEHRAETGVPVRGRGGHRGRPRERRVYGALDLGTNNCRLLVAKTNRRDFRVVDSFSRIVRLGEGIAATGRLAEAAMARTLDALGVCARVMARNRVGRARCVATEACRRAANCEEFVGRVRAETGLQLETVSADEEARLTLAGCAPLLDRRLPRALVFDIGGGSTELMWIEQTPESRPRILDLVSIPIGVVTLAERHGRGAVPEPLYERMVEDMDAAIAPFDHRHDIASEVARQRVFLLGTSGTVTTLGGLFLGLKRYERSKVDGLTMDFGAIRALSQRLACQDQGERARHPCIGPERADLVVMGCAVLEAVCRRWPVGRLRAADRGIREGLLLTMVSEARDRRGRR